jgi:hypothetical protein
MMVWGRTDIFHFLSEMIAARQAPALPLRGLIVARKCVGGSGIAVQGIAEDATESKKFLEQAGADAIPLSWNQAGTVRPAGGIMAEPTSPQPNPPDVLVADTELLALPLWAIVAFAARCARRVQPLLLSAWSEWPARHFEPVESAIAFAESVARNPNQLASHVDRTNEIAFGAWLDSAKEQSRVVCGLAIVHAARSAAEAAIAARTHVTSGNIRRDSEVMDRVVHSAMAAAMLAQRAVTAAFSYIDAHQWMIRSDIESLAALARQNKWTDESPVDVALLGPLWPPGAEPPWAKQPPNGTDVAGLQVTYTIPDDMSDDEAIAYINKHLAAMSDLHRAISGTGLRVIPPTDVQEPARPKVTVGA